MKDSNKSWRRHKMLADCWEVWIGKAMGPDGVSGWILRECKGQLIQPIWEVITNSKEEGRVPQEWKRANRVPIYKGGKKTDPLNYRPVTKVLSAKSMRY